MLRCIREIQPKWVVGENVFGIVNWSGGLVFDEVQSDLEAEGYEVQAYVLPACAVNAPHRRDRVWFVAHANNSGSEKSIVQHSDLFAGSVGNNEQTTADTDNQRWQEHNITTKSSRTEWITGGNNEISADTEQPRRESPDLATGAIRPEPGAWDNWPTIEPTICRRDDGLSARLDGITFSKWRNESIKAYGNAVVPQVVYQIFKVIEAYEPY